MKNWKRFAAMTMAMLLLLSLCACGGADAGEVMENAQQAVLNLSSMSYTMEMDMILSVQGESLRVLTDCTADYIAEPIAQKVDTAVSMGAVGHMNSTTYTVPEGDSYASYVTVDGGQSWYKTPVEDEQELKDYNMQSATASYLSGLINLEEVGTETVGGVEAVCYKAVVSADALEEVLELSGALNQLKSMGMVPEVLDLSEVKQGDIKIRVWVDKENMLPVRYELDMTAAAQNIMKVVMDEETSVVSMDRMTLVVELSNFDAVEAFTLPAGTENAQEMSEIPAA